VIDVVGGTYQEMCREPRWDELFGSGLRAAATLTSLTDEVRLWTYVAEQHRPTLEAYAIEYGVDTEAAEIPETLRFSYVHGLSEPWIHPPLHMISPAEPLEIDSSVVLRFGILEGDAVVAATRAVYDPQSAYDPRPFAENGSEAEHLALVLNSFEARALTAEQSPNRMGTALLKDQGAEVVVLKLGAAGVLVFTENGSERVPAFRTDRVFPIGSGDVFSAVFAHYWGENGYAPHEAAQQASRATAWYCATKQLRLPPRDKIGQKLHQPVQPTEGGRQPRRVYLAGPFFTTSQRWLIEETRDGLRQQGVAVFSPFHDVGIGPAHEVAPKDIAALNACDAVLAIVDGFDAGTLFEVGYARSRGTPVTAFVQSAPEEPLKMLVGTDCQIVDDFVTAIYLATWAALEH
jgi:nucleoside 2-deoxyribosyltransferase